MKPFQAFSKRAKQAASSVVFGKEVHVSPVTTDRYGRTVADVRLPNGVNLNHELVRQGWCWWFRKYAPQNRTLGKLEAEAREQRLGLWTDPNPMPPWEYRKAKSKQRQNLHMTYRMN